jgi:hypothetical protein
MVYMMNQKRVTGRRVAIVLAALCIILLAGLGAAVVNYTKMNSQIETLSDQLDSLNATLNATNELVAYAEGGAVISQGHTITLKYGYDIRSDDFTSGPDRRTFCAVYSPYDNSTLIMDLKVYWVLADFNISMSVQDGNALEMVNMYDYANASTIWTFNTNWTDRWTLPISRGWYTVSLIGPIHLPSGCGICPANPPRSQLPFIGVDCSLEVTISYEERLSPFVLVGTKTYT